MRRESTKVAGYPLIPRVSLLVAGILLVVASFIGVGYVSALDTETSGSSYRLYQNANSTTPGTPLAASDTSGQLGATGDAFRLRAGITARPNSINFTKMSLGSNHGCAIASGKVYCSGPNVKAEIGDGTATATNILVPVVTSGVLSGKVVTDVASGRLGSQPYNCVVASGLGYCWGSNNFGNLGVGQTSAGLASSNVPLAITTAAGVLQGRTVTNITAGDGHACAVADGLAFCWGTGGNGRLGTGNTTTATSPAPVVTASGVLLGKTVNSIGAGSGHGCVAASGQAYCWGTNVLGQLGNNSTTQSTSPAAVDTTGVLNGKTVIQVAAGNQTSCALTSEAKIYCWGDGQSGQLGNNTNSSDVAGYFSSIPVAPVSTALNSKTITAIAVGSGTVCAATADSLVYCWGNGGNGALGTGNSSSSKVPVLVTTSGVLNGKTVNSIQIGEQNTCTTTTDGGAYCWGKNTSGGLGIGSNSNVTVPNTVLTTNVAAGDGVTIAASASSYKLQFAQKTGATCSVQTGFADITTTSAIAWNANAGVTNGEAISSYANDPTTTGTKIYQTYQSAAGTFSNPTAINPSETGLWDFSLKDNSGLYNTSYCLRIANADGSAVPRYSQYPEIKTAPGELSLGIVTSGGLPVGSPAFAMPSTLVKTDCQTVNGVFGASEQRLRITNNLVTAGWSVSIAASAGPTATWVKNGGGTGYDFNDPSGSPAGCNSGSDGDGLAGQLQLNPSVGTLAPKSGCTNTGVSLGPLAGFNQGSINAITIASGSSASELYCYWDITGVGVTQAIPASQSEGSYTLDLTTTVVAQ